MNLKCPVCHTDKVTNLGSTTQENGGQIYVAEDMDCSTECYDTVDQFECENGHNFYLNTDTENWS